MSKMKAIEVEDVSSHFDSYPEIDLKPLAKMKEKFTFQGVIPRGNFSIHRQLGQSLEDAILAIPEKERDALFALYTAKDFQDRNPSKASDIIIDFSIPLLKEDKLTATPEAQLKFLTENYPILLSQLQTRSPYKPFLKCVYEQRKVLPSSDKNLSPKTCWWLSAWPKLELRACWESLKVLWVSSRITKVWAIQKACRGSYPRIGLRNVITSGVQLWKHFNPIWVGILSSMVFEGFIRKQCSTLGTGLIFTPSEVFPYFPVPWETATESIFPIPESELLAEIGLRFEALIEIREDILKLGEYKGLTDLYNHYDNPEITCSEIQKLREAHVELYNSVLKTYGWEDLIEDWIFDKPWVCKSNRYVPKEPIRREIIRRIGILNNERYEKES